MTRAFVLAGVIAVSGFLLIQFVFDGWPTVTVALFGGIVALGASLPVVEWHLDEASRKTVEEWIREDPSRVGQMVADVFVDAIVDGQITDPGYVDTVKQAETMAVSLRSLAVHGRGRLREDELRKAL